MCREYAENELQRLWIVGIIFILFSQVELNVVFVLFLLSRFCGENKGAVCLCLAYFFEKYSLLTII